MEYILLLVVGYLIGSVQSSILAGKIVKNIDIREHGSGNAGTTNVARVLGVKVAVVVFICDILKGVIPFLIVRHFFNVECALVIGLGAVLGHDFPAFMKFKGGKGVAISLGIITVYNPIIGIGALAVGVLIIIVTKYVSLAAVSLATIVFVFEVITYSSIISMIVITVLFALLIYQHRGNIKRLMKGEENKLTLKNKI